MEKIDFSILIILYFTLLIALLFYLIRTNTRKKCIPMHNGFLFSILFYFILIPIFIILNINDLISMEQSTGKYCSNTFERFIINNNMGNYLYSFLLVILSVIIFLFFYKISYKKNQSRNLVFKDDNIYKIVKVAMFCTFWIGLISLVVFFGSFGGISNALSYAEKMRNMSSSLVEEIGGIAALFKITARLITVTPFLIILLINIKKEYRDKYFPFFIISMIASVLFYIYNAGRMPIILFMLCFFYYFMCTKVKKTWSLILLLGIASLPLLDVFDSLFVYFNSGVWQMKSTNYLNYIYQFSYPYKNSLLLIDLNNTFGHRWFLDYFYAILDYFPGVSFEPPYVDLSLYVRGSDWMNLGGVPTDFITFSHMQLSFLGIIILSAVLGYFAQIIDYKTSLFNNKKVKNLLIAILTLYTFSSFVSFDPFSIIKGQFILLISIIVILASSKKEVS